jgi:site-specific recombinase XerD
MNELQRFKSLQQELRLSIQPVPQVSRFEQLGLRMIEDMQLRDLAERTQESYLRAIRKLAGHCRKSPDEVSEEELRDYFLYQTNVRKWSRVSSTIALCGIKFFYDHTIKRSWPTLHFV